MRVCWCGVRALRPFGDGYLECPSCSTLVRVEGRPTGTASAAAGEAGFYGRSYWFEHQRSLGLPDLEERSATDLTDRHLFWLRAVHRFCRPPARVLEIGAAHGGFTALLGWAGFEATGLELSPWVVEFAKRRYGVPMLLGPLEAQDLPDGSLDVVVAMDVLEHLTDPLSTVRRVREILSPEGVFIVQTPERPEGLDHRGLVDSGHRFREMLLPEHLHLFTRDGVEDLLRRAGLTGTRFLPPRFPHYDMFLVASRRPPAEIAGEASFPDSPTGRLVSALLRVEGSSGPDEAEGALGEEVRSLRSDLDAARRENEDLRRRSKSLREALSRSLESSEEQRQRHLGLASAVLALRDSPGYRRAVESGRLAEPDERLRIQAEAVVGSGGAVPAFPDNRREEVWARLSQAERRDAGALAVDLTAVLPGGENGGAKLVAKTLVSGLARLDPDRRILLLTHGDGHEELAELEAGNVRRERLSLEPGALSELFDREPVAALLCPMTAPPWEDARVPALCVVHDLLFRRYPEFFSAVEAAERESALQRASRVASRIVTVSEVVRREIVEALDLDERRVIVVANSMNGRLPRPSEVEIEKRLAEHDLVADGYLLYPANFWPHKNHGLLLTAFARHCRLHPESSLQLVLTGAENPSPADVVEAIAAWGLDERVHLAGFVSDGALAALLAGCRALIFPSLYEGFGIPVLEAMAAGRPVLCARAGSLPEVAGEAALYFDARNPEDMARAIARIETDSELVARLVEAGLHRAREIGDERRMVTAYRDLLDEIAVEPPTRSVLSGVFGDAWSGCRLSIGHAGGYDTLELGLANSRDEPVRITSVTEESREVEIAPLESVLLRVSLDPAGGREAFRIGPTFRPSERGGAEDSRELGVVVWRAALRGPADLQDLLETVPSP